MVLATVFTAVFALTGAATDGLARVFAEPPRDARPQVWWHWIGNNVTREGIANDLREMREAGIGGATIFTIATHAGDWNGKFSNPANPKMSYRNDEWWSLVRFAAAEAKRNGLALGIHNSPGFSHTGGPWIKPEQAMKELSISLEFVDGGAERMPKPPANRFGYAKDVALVAMPVGSTDIAQAKVFEPPFGDLKGTLPSGKWVIRRFAMICTGRRPIPAPEDIQWTSLEADKLSAEAMNVHIAHAVGELSTRLGKDLAFVVADSYEAKSCNWTDNMREEFRRRRGYDPLPWLVSLFDKRIKDGARFKEDLDLTVQELFTENCFRPLAAACRKAGYEFHLEPYGGPFNRWEAAMSADIPMIEFWGFKPVWCKDPGIGGYGKSTAAVGRALGRKIIATEAYTGMPEDSKWTAAPRHFKACTDATFARGVNRMVLHHWVHQPFDRRWKPGMTMGWWGTHFGSCQTWYEPGKEFFRYLTRCQAVLQRCTYGVDVLAVEEQPLALEFDAIPSSLFLSALKAEPNGEVSLPSGRRYRLLRIPSFAALSLPVLEKAVALARQGVNIRLAALPDRVRGLSGGAETRNRVKALRSELESLAAGKGNVTIGGRDEDVLSRLGVPPVVAAEGGRRGIDFEAAALRSGQDDLFFVANLTTNALHLALKLRTDKSKAELWFPATGRRFRSKDGVRDGKIVRMDMDFAPQESVFVVFRAKGVQKGLPTFAPTAVSTSLALTGPWTVSFPETTGAPRERLELKKLDSLSNASDPLVRHFSGTATYVTRFDWSGDPAEAVIDLGDVREIAEVSLNGKNLGVAWFSPFRLGATSALRKGSNELTVKVTNTWANRIIGDEGEPDDCKWNPPRKEKNGKPTEHGVALLETPAFVLDNSPRPSSNRVTFSFWRYHTQPKPLLPSGLLGPVKIDILHKAR